MLASNVFAAALFGISTVGAILAAGALFFLTSLNLELGTLNSLQPYILAAGMYFLALLFNAIYAMPARQMVAARRLLSVRLLTSAFPIVGPVAAGLYWGLPGAIWAYAGALLLSGITFWIMVRRSVA